MLSDVKNELRALIEEPLKIENCELADLVVSRYRNSATVKVFVYSEGGVSLDRCAQLSNIVGDLIEGTDLFEKGYTLEVSSPGLDRPLKTLIDFRYRVGEKVTVSFTEKKRKKVTGELLAVEDNNLLIKGKDEEMQINIDEIEQAKIVF